MRGSAFGDLTNIAICVIHLTIRTWFLFAISERTQEKRALTFDLSKIYNLSPSHLT